MQKQLLIAGGGIGGLAAAWACAGTDWKIHIFERASSFSEVGAGVQLGPNVTGVLRDWGMSSALATYAAFPDSLVVRHARHGGELARMPLGSAMEKRYGAPYVTVHRADLHSMLLQLVQHAGQVQLHTATTIDTVEQSKAGVHLTLREGVPVEGDALIAADGVWSNLRQQLLHDGVAQPTGYVAYRALVRQDTLPLALRSGQVRLWLGPGVHLVAYPVRQGEYLNVVAIVRGDPKASLETWDQEGATADLQAAVQTCHTSVRQLIEAIAHWRLWVLCGRPAMRGPQEMAHGCVAFLGDAAHPMLPFLSQGAGMAIEDAFVLGQCMNRGPGLAVPELFQSYAQQRWQRAARVQQRSASNGRLYHLTGPIGWARDASLRLLGAKLMDQPWLYGWRSA